MAAPKAPDTPPVQIEDLPHWAQVAFAARVALRVLPAYRSLANPRDRAIVGFRGAQACCFIPIAASLEGSVQYRRLAGRAAEEVVALGFQEGRERVANQCLAAAAQFVTVDAVDSGLLASLMAGYHDVAGTYRVYDVFEAAAADDAAQLAAYTLDQTAAVPPEFFERPLFNADGAIPREWQPVLNEWSALLNMVDLEDFFKLYLALCAGKGFSSEFVTAFVEAWARGTKDAKADDSSPVEGDVESDGPETPLAAESPATPATAAVAQTAEAAPKATAPPEPELLLLADRPVEKADRDLLGFKDYAQSLAVILNDRVATPFTMAINAPWGAGKTSLANMLVERLLADPGPPLRKPHIILRFNAWMYDDAANLASPLVTEVCRRADRERRLWKRIYQPLPGLMLDPSLRRWRNGIYFLLVIVLTLVGLWQVSEHLTHVEGRQKYDAAVNETYQQTTSRTPDGTTIYTDETVSQTRSRTPPPEVPPLLGPVDLALKWLQPRLVLLGTFLTAFAGLVGVLVKLLSSTSLLSFVQSPEKAADGGSIQAAQRTIGRLIKDATETGNRFFVFIDDIERCKPPRAVDVLDAVSQLLDHPNVVVVLLGDMSAVAAAAQVKYKDLAKIYVPAADLAALSTAQRQEVFGRLYIQKIVQYQFDLPALSRARIKAYVAELLESEDVASKRDAGQAA